MGLPLAEPAQDRTLLLDWLVITSEERLVDSQAWWVEDVTQQDAGHMENLAQQDTWRAEDLAHKEAQDWADQLFRARFLALEEQHREAVEQQAARAVEETEEDHWVLDNVLALAVTFITPAALSPIVPPWQPPTAQ
ncbi:hypothetical protein Y1Q_0019141 [Alligator mississippiensis]|uniref:Uncharacterized protein n=1 Tax=Alligator mississippiensis TaxID=8496 RepID=A0A151MQ53_ALLMI|nr:hypothetical protein Y1Q_0019141 [Alligator mississippiensis]